MRHPLCNTAFERRGRFPAAGCNLLALPELRSPSFLFITRYKSGKFLLPSQTRSLKVFARESGHLFRFVECRNNNNLFHFRTDGRTVCFCGYLQINWSSVRPSVRLVRPKQQPTSRSNEVWEGRKRTHSCLPTADVSSRAASRECWAKVAFFTCGLCHTSQAVGGG